MKFIELQNLERRKTASQEQALNSFQQEMYREFLEKQARKSTASQQPFEYFYEDVISAKLNLDFKTRLGQTYYQLAEDDARSCLEICNEFRKLSQWQVSGWLNNALKFADNLVLHYIQDISKKNPQKYPEAGDEKSRYVQLSKMEGSISLAGSFLKDLYEERNRLEHRTITRSDGSQELLRPQRNKVRKMVGKMYPEVLRRMGEKKYE
jgi:hypothetical protein